MLERAVAEMVTVPLKVLTAGSSSRAPAEPSKS